MKSYSLSLYTHIWDFGLPNFLPLLFVKSYDSQHHTIPPSINVLAQGLYPEVYILYTLSTGTKPCFPKIMNDLLFQIESEIKIPEQKYPQEYPGSEEERRIRGR